MATESSGKIDEELESEVDTLQAMFDENEITINRKNNMMVIDYMTTVTNNNKKIKVKLIFAFNMNNIASSIIITVKNTSKNKNNLTTETIALIVSYLMDKFKQEIENMPIYQCIDYFNNELKQNPSLFTSKNNNKKKKQSVNVIVNEEKMIETEAEYIAFIRFNHLLHGKHHKKENEMLSQLKSFKNCSNNFFGYYFYGKPGIICICSTSDNIKKYAKKCNEIGKKSCITNILDINEKQLNLNIDKNTIKTIGNDSHEKLDRNQLCELLNNLQIQDIKNVLNIILIGKETDFCVSNNDDIVRDIYGAGCKYDFRVEIKTSNGPYAFSNGNLYLSIYGENENKLVDKYRFEVKKQKKTTNIQFNFEFDDILFLNDKIGLLNKLYFENDSKDSWQCEWIKISVYQISVSKGKKKKNKKNKAKLKQEYQAKMRKWINKNTPRYAYLSCNK